MKEDDERGLGCYRESSQNPDILWEAEKNLCNRKKKKVMINKKRQISFHERAILGTWFWTCQVWDVF